MMQASPNRRADTQVRPYRHIVNQKMGWVGADLCVCPVGGPAIWRLLCGNDHVLFYVTFLYCTLVTFPIYARHTRSILR